jgi:hypothetical protein
MKELHKILDEMRYELSQKNIYVKSK